MFIFFQQHTDSRHFTAHPLEKPWRSDRELGQSVTQAEVCCKQPLSFLYLLPRWVSSQPSSFVSLLSPTTPTPCTREPLNLPASITILRLCGSQKFNLCLSLVFLPFFPHPAVMSAPHPLPCLNSTLHAPALSLPSFPLPLLLPFLILSHSHCSLSFGRC